MFLIDNNFSIMLITPLSISCQQVALNTTQHPTTWGHTPKSTGRKSKKRPDNAGI